MLHPRTSGDALDQLDILGERQTQRPAIKAEVIASGSDGTTGFDNDSRSVTVDATHPTFTINPPADVVQPAPPFIATITGTATDSGGVDAVEWQFGSSSWQVATVLRTGQPRCPCQDWACTMCFSACGTKWAT